MNAQPLIKVPSLIRECSYYHVVDERRGMLIFRVVGAGLMALGALACLIILLLPLGVLQKVSLFLHSPGKALWLLFVSGLALGAILFWIGSEDRHNRRLSKVGGSLLLLLAFGTAAEILLIKAYKTEVNSTTPLWWLFLIFTLLGGIGVYIPEHIKREEEAKEAERIKREAENRRRAEEKRTSATVYLFKLRR